MTAQPVAPDVLAAPRPGALSGNLLGAASMVVWAAGFPALDALIPTWDPFALVVGRFAMALLLLVPLMLWLEGVPRAMPWGRAFLYGGIGLAGGSVTLILAQAATDPVTVAVIASVSPITAALVEWATDRRALSRGFGLGVAFSVLGGVIATWGAGAGSGDLWLGAVLAVLSCVVFSWGSHMTVRGLPGQSALGQAVATMTGGLLAGLLALGLSAALGGEGFPPGAGSARDLGLLAVYGMGGMALSQLLFILAIRRIGVGLASFHVNGAPFYVMLIMLAFGGAWSWAQAAGAAVVALGVIVAQRR